MSPDFVSAPLTLKMGEQIFVVNGIKGLKVIEGITENGKSIKALALDFDVGACAEGQKIWDATESSAAISL